MKRLKQIDIAAFEMTWDGSIAPSKGISPFSHLTHTHIQRTYRLVTSEKTVLVSKLMSPNKLTEINLTFLRRSTVPHFMSFLFSSPLLSLSLFIISSVCLAQSCPKWNSHDFYKTWQIHRGVLFRHLNGSSVKVHFVHNNRENVGCKWAEREREREEWK